MDLDIHADSLIRQAKRAEYGPLLLEYGDETLKHGRGWKWDEVDMEAIADADRKDAITMIANAKEEIDWLKKQMDWLEQLMDSAKDRKSHGDQTQLVFKPDGRDTE